ncbi:MAG: hypothetical protein H6719_32145 [Sandaracinaceae bacterium]|nr:hypothetical protein [Sandaracinaceae bacterium]
MGGRGKSSGVAPALPRTIASPLNFGDGNAITLEQLEASAGRRLAAVPPRDVARGVEGIVTDLLASKPADFARREGELARAVTAVAREIERRPPREREAFADSLAPLLARLREQAEGGRS